MSKTITKTKINTLEDIKQREQIVKISNDDYKTILSNISNLENELEETLKDYNELNDDNERKNEYENRRTETNLNYENRINLPKLTEKEIYSEDLDGWEF